MTSTHDIRSHGICQVAIAPIRSLPSDTAEIVTQLLFGDYVEVIEKGKPWIKIFFPADNYEGYMDFKQLKYISPEMYEQESKLKHPVLCNGQMRFLGPIGVQQIIFGSNLPNYSSGKIRLGNEEYELDPQTKIAGSIVDTALSYLSTPYLWGGKGIYGIDCSGLTQMVAKVHGKDIPRDASQQVKVGSEISFENRLAGDFVFFENKKGIIHHVGILINKDEIIHAAGHVRIDPYNQKGIFRKDFNDYTHIHHSIRRI